MKYVLTLVLLFCLHAQPALAQVAFSAATSADTGANAEVNLTYAHTISGSNRLLIVGVHTRTSGSADLVTGVTYGGVGLTRLCGGVVGGTVSTLWYLVNPNTGTADVVTTLSGSQRHVSGAVSFTGVHQSAPLGTCVTSASNTTTSRTVDVDSEIGGMVIAVGSKTDSDVGITLGGSETSRYAEQGTNATTNNNVVATGSTRPGDTSVAMSISWTPDSEASGLAGVGIKAAALSDPSMPQQTIEIQ